MASLTMKLEKLVRWPYWFLSSISNKKMFIDGKINRYRFLDDVFFRDKSEFAKALEENKISSASWWAKQSKFEYQKRFPQRFANLEKILLESFLPLFSEKPIMLDIGSANGDWTAKVAP